MDVRQRLLAGHHRPSLEERLIALCVLCTLLLFSHPAFLGCFETGTWDVAQAVLKPLILLPLPQCGVGMAYMLPHWWSGGAFLPLLRWPLSEACTEFPVTQSLQVCLGFAEPKGVGGSRG